MIVEIQPPYTNLSMRSMSHFMGGGISNCPEWQRDLAYELADLNITLLNPRRENFDIHDPFQKEDQVAWEFNSIEAANSVSLWFCKETLNPIVLLELGRMLEKKDKPLFVGADPDYQRIEDVLLQLKHGRPEVEMTYSIPDLARNIRNWYGSLNRPKLFDTLKPSAKTVYRNLFQTPRLQAAA